MLYPKKKELANALENIQKSALGIIVPSMSYSEAMASDWSAFLTRAQGKRMYKVYLKNFSW